MPQVRLINVKETANDEQTLDRLKDMFNIFVLYVHRYAPFDTMRLDLKVSRAYKKRGNRWSSVPPSEAFALPDTVRNRQR